MKKLFILTLCCLFLEVVSSAQTDSTKTIHHNVNSMAFTPDDQRIVSGCSDGTIQIWNKEGKLVFSTSLIDKNYNSTNREITKIAISPDGTRIAAYLNYDVYLLTVRGNVIKKIDVENEILKFSPDNIHLFFAKEKEGEIYCVDDTGQIVKQFRIIPDYTNKKGDVPEVLICEMLIKHDGSLVLLNRFTINEKKGLYDFWIYEYNPALELTEKTKVPFLNPCISKAILSATNDFSLLYVNGQGFIENTDNYENFYFDIKTKAFKIEKYSIGITNRLIPDGSGIFNISGSSLIVYDLHPTTYFEEKYRYDIPDMNWENNFFIDNKKQNVVLAYKDKPLQMFCIKTHNKLFDFDETKIVEDTYNYESTVQKPAIALTDTRPKIDASAFAMFSKTTYPKTIETTSKGCVAGDCFEGFGYFVQSETEEYCGYFANGTRQSIGQLHHPSEAVMYNGFFDAGKPNGYGNIKYYDRNLFEIGTFKDFMPDGEMTIYKDGNMKNGLYKGDQITEITRTTGCLSGDCLAGNGVYQMEDGTRFVGDFNSNGLDKGIWFENKARVVKFEAVNSSNQFCGMTDIFSPNGEVIHGTFLNGKMNGEVFIKSSLFAKTLFIEGTFENGLGTRITVQFRDGRKWVGKQDSETASWATGTGTMTYTDGTTKTGKFNDGEFVSL
jgi:WD40 repeat protein